MSDVSQYQLTYEISPILLTGGIATNAGILPIIQLTQGGNFGSDMSYSQYYAHFKALPGATLQDNEIGTYPFANRSIAANAVIFKPLVIPMLMQIPVNQPGSMFSRFSTSSSLINSLNMHVQSGGLFTVITPSYMYEGCILLNIKDVSTGEDKKVQTAWQWNFVQPLTSLSQATTVQNNLMQQMTSQTQITNPQWSGLPNQTGTSPVNPLMQQSIQSAIGNNQQVLNTP